MAAVSPLVTPMAVGMLTYLLADSVQRYALRGGSAFARQESSKPLLLLLHPPERDVTLKCYCSEQLKINADNGGMKGKPCPLVPGHSLICRPGLGQRNRSSSVLPMWKDRQRGGWCKVSLKSGS